MKQVIDLSCAIMNVEKRFYEIVNICRMGSYRGSVIGEKRV